MSWPSKAIFLKDLTFPDDKNDKVPSSGHEVRKCQFKDSDGQIKTGFFKIIDTASYPDLLAKYTVAISVAIRCTLGDRASEDRLVYKEKSLCGTLSIEMPQYKPLLTSTQSLPLNKEEAELACPSKKTLLKYDVASLLVSAWRYKCDDRHPGNFSLFGLIDWDMCLYPYTYIIKGPRGSDIFFKKNPLRDMEFSTKDLDNFPIIKNRTHWPTNDHPGNMYLLKNYANREEFQNLAGNNIAPFTDKTENIIFQEQVFKAILKELLTFNPLTLSERLKEYIGEEKLDFSTLPNEKSKQLKKAYPELYNDVTDGQPFIDHFLTLAQFEYDKFYTLVVDYIGCKKNTKGASVPSFYRFLRNTPSAFQETYAWLKKNDKHFDEEQILQRYHEIWRDSHTQMLHEGLIKELKKLTHALNKILRISETPQSSDCSNMSFTSQSLRDSLLSKNPIHSDQNNNLSLAYHKLRQLIKSIELHATQYFERSKGHTLKLADNQTFCTSMNELSTSSSKITKHLMSTTWGSIFEKWCKKFEQFYIGLDLSHHLNTNDSHLTAGPELDYSDLMLLPHTHPEIVRACFATLFTWAKNTDQFKLNEIISATLKKYQPNIVSANLFSSRHRFVPISKYLETHLENLQKKTDVINGANLLGIIFSWGGTGPGSFNILLIKALLRNMLDNIPLTPPLRIVKDAMNPSQKDAMHSPEFKYAYYASEAQRIAKNDKSFNHPYAKYNIERFQASLFNEVNNIPSETFTKILQEAHNRYQPSLAESKNLVKVFFHAGKEKLLPKRTLPGNNDSHCSRLANIFCEGGNKTNSLNTILLQGLLAHFQNTKKPYPDLAPAFNVSVEEIAVYGGALKEYAPHYIKIDSRLRLL